jgi:hypothetical protein
VENVAFPVIGAGAWIIVIFKLIAQFKEPNLQRAFVIGLIGAPGVSYLVAAPFLYHRFNALLGIPNVGTVAVYWGVMVFAFCAIAFLAGVVHSREAAKTRLWLWGAGYATAMILMAVLFALAPVEVEAEGSTGFDKMYADSPYVPWFLAVFNLSFAVGLIAIGPYCWRWSKITDRRWLKKGLPWIAVASLCGLFYVIPKIVYIVLRQFGTDVDLLNTWAPLGAMAASVCYITGFVICAMGPAGDFTTRWKAYQAIYPMWTALMEPFPDLVLASTRGPKDPRLAIRPHRLKTLLYRRIVEIRDARLRLRPWFDPAIHGADAAAIEAAQLKAALAKRAGGAEERLHDLEDKNWLAEGNLAAEATWFVAVAEKFRA